MSDVVTVDGATFDSVIVQITGNGEKGDKGDKGDTPNTADLEQAVTLSQAASRDAETAAGVAVAAGEMAQAAADVLTRSGFARSPTFLITSLAPITLPSPDWKITDFYVGNVKQDDEDGGFSQIGDQLFLTDPSYVGERSYFVYRIALPPANEIALQPYNSLAEARLAFVAAGITTILVRAGAWILRYKIDPLGTALTTLGGVKWSPAEQATVLHFGAVGDGTTDDTAAFTLAAAFSRVVEVPFSAAGYNVANTVVTGGSIFMLRGTPTSQYKGTATTDHIKTITLEGGNGITQQYVPDHLFAKHDQIQKIRQTTFQSPNLRSNDYGIFQSLNGPDITDPVGALGYVFNRLSTNWRVARTPGVGLNGSETNSYVRSLAVTLNVGGPDFDVQSVNPFSSSLLLDQATTCTGDLVGGGSAVSVSAAAPNAKAYGHTSSFTAKSGSVSPQGTGHEVDIFIEVGAVVEKVFGYQAWASVDAYPTGIFAPFVAAKNGQAGKLGWKQFLLINNQGGSGPAIAPTGSIIESDGNSAFTVANFINLPNMTVTGNLIDVPNVTLSGAGTLTLNGDVALLNGKGLNLPATPAPVHAGVAVGTRKLISFAEGTFQPTLSDGTNTVATSYTTRTGSWQRVGGRIHASCRIVITSLESVTGDLRIEGLPEAAIGDQSYAVTVGEVGGMALGAVGRTVSAYIQNGQRYINLRLNDVATGQSALLASEFSATGAISLSFSYRIS